MEQNTPQHKSFLWHLDIEPFTWKTCYGEQCPSFVTEENKEVWRRYLEKLIKKHLKAEVMNSPEFREIETMVNYEKLVRIKNDEQRKRMMERQRYWASSYYWHNKEYDEQEYMMYRKQTEIIVTIFYEGVLRGTQYGNHPRTKYALKIHSIIENLMNKDWSKVNETLKS